MLHLTTFQDLRRYVLHTLCHKADLNDDTPMLEEDIFRGGKPCGIEYVLLGPRALRLSAIWDALTERVLFYDHHLEKFQIVRVAGPSLEDFEQRERVLVQTANTWKGK